MAQAVDDLANDLLEVDDAALVDRLHQPADFGDVSGLARGIILQVENLQPGDHALAVVEQLQHLFDVQVGQVQRDAVAGMQRR